MFSYLVKRKVSSRWIDESYLICLLAGYGCSISLLDQFSPSEPNLIITILLGEAFCFVFFLLVGVPISLKYKNDD